MRRKEFPCSLVEQNGMVYDCSITFHHLFVQVRHSHLFTAVWQLKRNHEVAKMAMNIDLPHTVSPEDDWLDFKGAMDYLRTSRSTIYRLMWSGQLTGKKVGLGIGTWRFSRAALRQCMRDQEARVPASSARFRPAMAG